jgi:hypothetical protein
LEKEKDPYVEEVFKSLSKLKPQWKLTRDIADGGSGFVSESVLTFSRSASLWIVRLYNDNFAFKKITPEWVQTFSNLILSSPYVFVVYDIHHRILEWSVEQEKFCPPFTKDKKIQEAKSERESYTLSPV